MRIQKGQRLSPSTEFKKGHKTIHKPDYGSRTSKRLMGHVVTEATREKLRQANLGKKHPPRSESFKKKASERMMGNTNGGKGPTCGAWKGGITPINRAIRTSTEYKLWRKAVFERDGYACIWCHAKSRKGRSLLRAHFRPI